LVEENSFFANIAFRLVRKHIAGTTVATVLKKAMVLNKEGMGATITFLNDHVDSQAKAKYNESAYMQLLHQISRLSIRAAISIRPSQLGYAIDEKMADKYLFNILGYAEKNGITVWLEYEKKLPYADHLIRNNDGASDALGVEIPYSVALKWESGSPHRKLIKVVPDIENGEDYNNPGNRKDKRRKEATITEYVECLDTVYNTGASLSLFVHDDKFAMKVIAKSKHRKGLILELPFGYSKKKLAKISKEKINVNIYTPYGKDWVPYAVNRLTEGKRHKIAKLILEGRHPE
jgi:proline dehydrogenase